MSSGSYGSKALLIGSFLGVSAYGSIETTEKSKNETQKFPRPLTGMRVNIEFV